MRPRPDYIALTNVVHNGVRAYNAGDDVPASAVENLGLEIGVHVKAARFDLVPRPAGNAARAEWERYALGQGATVEEIADLTRAELIGRYPENATAADADSLPKTNPNPAPDLVALQATEQTNTVEPPGRDARRADWVEYAVARGMPRDVADDSTVAQLQAFDYDNAYGPR